MYEKVRRRCVDKEIATKLVAIYSTSRIKACYFGGSGETRTRDQRIKSPLHYGLSYRPTLQN